MKPAFVEFIHDTRFADLPPEVAAMARTCVLDLIGVTCAGSRTALSRIARNFATRQFAASEDGNTARLILDGRRASVPGVAFAGAATIDSFDAHDGHVLTKGHAGVAVWPAVLGLLQVAGSREGRALLASVVIGYEIAIRAGIALHATARDYHTSGAWSALACAALGARILRLDGTATRHALGIAEVHHGPRSPMMRCIDHPTMVKDGSAWGALSGVTAAFLAADGFTGAPAMLAEAPEVAEYWVDLGTRWRDSGAVFQGLSGVPLGAAGGGSGDRLAATIRPAPGGDRGHHGREFEAAVRLVCRAPATTRKRNTACRSPSPPPLCAGPSVRTRSIGAASRTRKFDA